MKMSCLKNSSNSTAHSASQTPPVISGQTNAMAHPMYPYEDAEELAMPHLQMNLNGQTYYSDENGGFVTNINQALNNVPVSLQGVGAQSILTALHLLEI